MESVDEKKRLPVKPLQEVETSNTTQTVESSYHPEIFHTHVCAVYTTHSYYLRVVFILLKASDCTVTI